MYPYYRVLHHHAPSRIFWFILGAGAATWWHHSRLMHEHRAYSFPCLMHPRRAQGQNDPSRPFGDVGSQEHTGWKSSSGPDRDGSVGWNQRDWEQDKERLRHLQKRAGETVVDLSESTLDSIVATAESLKTKLTELRAERERIQGEKKDSRLAA